MKKDKKMLAALNKLQLCGATNAVDLAAATGITTSTLRQAFARLEEVGIVKSHRMKFPIKFTVEPDWRQRYEAYLDERHARQVAAGRRSPTKFVKAAPIEKIVIKPGADEERRKKVALMVSAAAALRPDVRTTWRGSVPQWEAVA